MRSPLTTRLLEERTMRPVFATLVTIVSVGAFVTRDDEVVSWSLLAPTLFVYWMWAVTTRFPRFVMHLFGLTIPLVLNLIESNEEVSMFISVFTVAVIASIEPRRGYVRVVIPLFIFVMVTLGIVEAMDSFAWPNWLVGTVFAWLAGEIMWRFSSTVDELEHTRSLVADQAALQERRRIARDVHDLVGHSLSVMMLHVSGARHLVHSDPHEAERALEQAEEAGRRSLAEIRRTVGLLRDETDAAAAVIPSADLTDVRNLVDEFAAAGLAIRLEVDGPVETVEPAAALAGYRVIQEALTNVSRHTVDAQVTVAVVVDDETCEIVVANRGGETIDLGRGSGFGLVSMRERSKSVGGSLLAGPTSDGWTVEASLPVAAAGFVR